MVKKSFTIHDLPTSERPRERLQRYGAEALSTQEILALILGQGISGESVTVTAQRLLSQFSSIRGMAGALVRVIGPAKTCQIKAALDLASRLDSDGEPGEKPTVKIPDKIANLMKPRLQDKKKEYFIALLLNTRSQLIKSSEISVGSLDGTIVHPREVFKEALSASAASAIFVHNHPSGNPEPSEEDIELTERLVQAGEIMGVEVLNHIVFGDNKYISLKREGLF